jgi:signal transduction histidine kinase/CheY-like chemotaxis protein
VTLAFTSVVYRLGRMLCWLWIMAIVGFPSAASAWNHQVKSPVASIPLKADGYNLAPYLQYWHDKKGSASFEDAFQLYGRGQFQLLPDESPNMGFRQGNNWFYLSLRNPSHYKRLLLLEVDYAVLDQLELYCLGADKAPMYYPSGDHVQFSSRTLQVRNFVFPLAMDSNEVVNCMIRVRSSTNIVLPLRAYDNLSYIEHTQAMERLLGGLYGIALALLIYNVIQYVLVRQSVFLYFSLHVVGGVCYMTFMDGTLARFWIGIEMQDVGALLAICLAIGSAVLFAKEFLQLGQQHPLLLKIGHLFVVGAFALFFMSLIGPLHVTHVVASVYTILASVYLVTIGVIRWLDGYMPARIYLAGFGLAFVMVIWIVLNLFYLRADVRWITYGVNVVWVIELIVLSFAISMRISRMEKEHVALSQTIQKIKDESHIQTEFLAKVSHEIRTPMNGVLGLVELLLATPLNKDQKRYINAIQNAGKGLLDVINDVLDFSRIEAGKMSLKSEPFELQSVLVDACSIYEFDARLKGMELGCFIAPGTPLQLIGDSARIRQIILNTLSNALKYTEKGYVHINVQLTDQIHNDKLVVRFEVEDSGVGIAGEDQAKLFQSYSQLNSGSSKLTAGTGLGLVISQQFVELMGGKMGVKSELGKGSCFWFDIPLGLPDNVTVADRSIVLELFDGVDLDQEYVAFSEKTVADKLLPHSPCDQPRVLVVEDNEINQNVLVEFLNKMGVIADIADNGRAAIEKCQMVDHPFDLVLMDCVMPVMDGYEAATRIIRWQKMKGLKNTPIIALSAHALDKHRSMALEAGMVDYLSKPVSFHHLRAKLSRYLDIE